MAASLGISRCPESDRFNLGDLQPLPAETTVRVAPPARILPLPTLKYFVMTSQRWLILVAQPLQGGSEIRVRDSSRFSTVDCCRASSIESSNGKTHRNPVVCMTINISPD